MGGSSRVKNVMSSAELTRNSVKDAAYEIHMSRNFLLFLGIWQMENFGKISWRFILNNLSVIACCYAICIRLLPAFFYIIIDAKDVYQILTLISRAFFCVMAGVKYVLLQSHRRDIKKFMKHIEIDWLRVNTIDGREIMLTYARYGHLVIKISASFTFFAATWHAILPFVVKKIAASNTSNTTMIVSVRKFAVPSHFGCSFVTQTPVYEIIYTSQVIATFVLHLMGVACYSLAVVIVMHACGQLKILMNMINRLIIASNETNTSYDNFNGRLANIIKHHARALRFITSAEEMLRGICLVDVGGYTVQMCFLAYFNLVEFRSERINVVAILVYATLFITFLFNIFSFCYIGELLTQECANIGKTTYMIDWHHLPGKKSLVLCLIIARAQNPVTLTAGGAIQLSFRCFGSVIKTSMGYFNMLRTMTE